MTHDVVIVGGGPTGLMLAGELALAGVAVAIVERRATQEVAGTRAGGLAARTLEVLDQRGIADRFLARGKTMQFGGFAMIPLPIADFPTRHPYGLALPQQQIEDVLAEWVAELGVPTDRGCDATAIAQDAAGVDVMLADGRTLRAQYVVGCDGGRSLVRKQAGIAFVGWEASTSYLLAEAEMTDPPAPSIRLTEKGQYAIGKIEGTNRVRIVLQEEPLRHGEPTVAELRAALVAAYGTDFGMHTTPWLSRFTDAARQAVTYRAGRVLLAGDAAHVHSPVGGQGLNTGVQDAVNLGWKLAQVVQGGSPEALLDTYGAERHPVAARVLQLTMAQTALRRGDDRSKAAHAAVVDLLSMAEPRKRYAAMMAGLDIQYDLGGGPGAVAHPLVGRRMPDLELETAAGAQRVSTLLHAARPLLIRFGGAPVAAEIAHARVQVIDARYTGAWELPVLGAVPAPTAVLIRPDGHVAWAAEAGNADAAGLAAAVARWFA